MAGTTARTELRLPCSAVDQFARLTNLVALLLETRVPLTMEHITDELAEGYPDKFTARRTAFERDKAVLRSLGVPLRQEVLSGDQAGRTGYWIERSEFELGDLGLADDERRALQVAIAMVHVEPSWTEQAWWKLEQPGDESPVDAPPLTASLPADPVLPLLHEGIARRAEVRFGYRGRQRRLHPYGLLSRDGFWYVVGYDVDAAALRAYRRDRIEGKVIVGAAEVFERPEGFRVADVFPADPKLLGGESAGALEATVWIGAARARATVAELGDEAVREQRGDGSVVVAVPCVNLPAFRSWVLGFLEEAEVLGPPEVRDEIVRWLREVVSQ